MTILFKRKCHQLYLLLLVHGSIGQSLLSNNQSIPTTLPEFRGSSIFFVLSCRLSLCLSPSEYSWLLWLALLYLLLTLDFGSSRSASREFAESLSTTVSPLNLKIILYFYIVITDNNFFILLLNNYLENLSSNLPVLRLLSRLEVVVLSFVVFLVNNGLYESPRLKPPELSLANCSSLCSAIGWTISDP